MTFCLSCKLSWNVFWTQGYRFFYPNALATELGSSWTLPTLVTTGGSGCYSERPMLSSPSPGQTKIYLSGLSSGFAVSAQHRWLISFYFSVKWHRCRKLTTVWLHPGRVYVLVPICIGSAPSCREIVTTCLQDRTQCGKAGPAMCGGLSMTEVHTSVCRICVEFNLALRHFLPHLRSQTTHWQCIT